MKIVVINLDYRKDRLQTFNTTNPNLTYERYSAVDGNSLSYTQLLKDGFDVNHDWTDPLLKTPLTKGEVGCFLSHWNLWNKCIEENESLLILEDDAILTHRFDINEISNLSYDFVYLGYKEMGEKKKVDDKFLTPDYPYWTLAYLIRPEAARILVNDVIKCNIIPVDEYLPTMMKRLNVVGYEKNVVTPISRNILGSNVLAKSRYDYFLDFEVHVCTVATDEKKAYKLKSVSNLINLGKGVKWEGGNMKGQGGGHKINLIKEYIKDKKDSDVLLFLDGYDTFISDSISEILYRYLEFNSQIVVSSERICWPDELIAPKLKELNINQNTPYQYLNSGMYIGRIGRLKELLAHPLQNDEDDQFYMQREYLRNPKGIVCDVEQYMFITSDYSVIQRNGQLYNPITRCYGCAYHGNGGVKEKQRCEILYHQFYSQFNYVPTKSYDILSDDILLIDFMSEDMCRNMISLAEEKQFRIMEGDIVPAQELRLREIEQWDKLEKHWMSTVYDIVYGYWYPCHMTGLRDAFIIKYEMDKQRELRLHNDASLVTGSVKLNDDYTGGVLEFPRQKINNADIPVGKCILFPSQVTHGHQSTKLESGIKYSLTIWSSRFKGDIN